MGAPRSVKTLAEGTVPGPDSTESGLLFSSYSCILNAVPSLRRPSPLFWVYVPLFH